MVMFPRRRLTTAPLRARPEGRHRFAGNDFLLLNLGLVGEPDTALPVGPALKEQAIGLRHAINAIRKLLQLPPLRSGKLT